MCEPYGGGRQPPVLPVAYRRMEWYNSEVFWAGVSAFCAPQSPLCRGRWHGAAVTKVIIPSRLPASQSHTKGFGLYACRRGGTFAPPRRTQPPLQSGRPSVALRAALSAAVHPPLPTRSCDLAGTPNSKSVLGLRPKNPRTGTPARNGCAVPKRGLNGAYRVSATHFYRLPRWSAEWRTTTPVPSSEEGELCGRSANTLQFAASFLGKSPPRTLSPRPAKPQASLA